MFDLVSYWPYSLNGLAVFGLAFGDFGWVMIIVRRSMAKARWLLLSCAIVRSQHVVKNIVSCMPSQKADRKML